MGKGRLGAKKYFVFSAGWGCWRSWLDRAKRRIREHYQWGKIAAEIERVYFEMMGWELAETLRHGGRLGVRRRQRQRRQGTSGQDKGKR